MNYEIKPLVGVGPINLGMSKAEVESHFGKPEFEEEKRVCYFSSFMIDFDDDGKVEFIELGESEEYTTSLNGIDLHRVPAEDAVSIVGKSDKFDEDDPELGYSYIFKKIQMSLWRGSIPEDNEDEDGKYFEAIGIAQNDYFE